jgi:hypothetical protein
MLKSGLLEDEALTQALKSNELTPPIHHLRRWFNGMVKARAFTRRGSDQALKSNESLYELQVKATTYDGNRSHLVANFFASRWKRRQIDAKKARLL